MHGARSGLAASERLDWLRLWRSENVGPRTFFDLLRATGSAAAALDMLPELARRGGLRRRIRACSRDDAAREADALAAIGGHLLAWGEPGFPRALAAIPDPPPIISALGHLDLLDRNSVAVVGARNASGVGRRFARGLAAELGAGGLVVVSGLARGIDAEAHAGALAHGTVAAQAGGIDVVYPAENQALYESIRDAGALVSEQPLGLEPQARHFPRRNRIVSGLALGVVVVEASRRSGSLITARLALEQGREVFAVPGSPLDPRHGGTNLLIRQGAVLTESAEDVLSSLAGMTSRRLGETPEAPAGIGISSKEISELDVTDADRERVMAALGPTPLLVDELVRQCQLTAAEVMIVMLELELAGRVIRHPGGSISISDQ